MWRAVVWSGVLALAGPVGAQDAPPPPAGDGPPVLVSGRPIATVIDRDVQDWVTFRCAIPPDAVELAVTCSGAAADLDVYLRFGAAIEDWDIDADHWAATAEWNEELRVSRWHDPPLVPGECWIDVVYRLTTPVRIDGVRTRRIPVTVQCDVVRATPVATLAPTAAQPTTSAAGTLQHANGHAAFFVLDVPPDATAVRLDVADVAGDVDLLVQRSTWPLVTAEVDLEAATLAGRESLVLDGRSQPPLAPGRWHVAVLDRVQADVPIPFVLHATLGRTAPAPLLVIPAQRVGRTPLERALYGTVEVVAPHNAGSGSLCTPDGLFLTNHHVVVRGDGAIPIGPDLVVGLTLDPRQPPVECLRAVVLHADRDRDLALCQVTAGLYGQPLPAGYRFHPIPLGDPDALQIGDPIGLVGFPDTGGMRSRVSVTYTRGLVAGFERHAHGYLIKTDADLSNGSSGGAALDGEFRLVGAPSDTVGAAEGYGQLGYIRPLAMLPAAWRATIDAHLANRR